ncbi:MAG: class I SAM-dependent methyltransferase [Hahellaceae bacterium]|nr:class I SAM-dependent methyltransferase [Hahellaceae bacterium]
MSNRTLTLNDELYQYLCDHSLREPELLASLREETARDPMARMQIAPEQGQFIALLIKMLGVRNAIEVGTFTGYSALCMALAMPRDGRLVCCDISESWTQVARRYWQTAGVDHKIQLHIAHAQATLERLLKTEGARTFDFAFIDADKENYDSYYELCLRLLRPGGVIMLDNMLWGGRVADVATQDADTRALRALNNKLKDDVRVDISLLPVADGITLVRKR